MMTDFEKWWDAAVKRHEVPMWDSNKDSARKAWHAAIEWFTSEDKESGEPSEVSVSGVPYKVPQNSIGGEHD